MPGTATGSASRSWNILCDFDGTVTPDDVIDGLLERFGRPGWQELEDDWRAGVRPDQFLVKPFGLRELRQVVVRFCGQGAHPLRVGVGAAQARE